LKIDEDAKNDPPRPETGKPDQRRVHQMILGKRRSGGMDSWAQEDWKNGWQRFLQMLGDGKSGTPYD